MLSEMLRVTCLLHANINSAPCRILASSTVTSQQEKHDQDEENKMWSKNHCYRKLYPWKTRKEFAELLEKNVLYNHGGLIAINKPYGVPVHAMKNSPNKSSKPASKGGYGESPYSIEDAFPFLKKSLGVDHLQILRSTERYTSGITLLASTEQAACRVQKAILRVKPLKMRHMVYWAITKGYPIIPSVDERIGIQLVDLENGEKQPVIVKEFSKTKVNKQIVKPVRVMYNTIVVNKQLATALIEMETNLVKWDFLHVYASTRVTSILGEWKYAARVKSVFGHPIIISPYNSSAYKCEPLADSVCERLQIPKGKSGCMCVPVMLHQHKLILPQYEKGENLVITAPFADHFLWTCKQLDLMFDPNDNQDNSGN